MCPPTTKHKDKWGSWAVRVHISRVIKLIPFLKTQLNAEWRKKLSSEMNFPAFRWAHPWQSCQMDLSFCPCRKIKPYIRFRPVLPKQLYQEADNMSRNWEKWNVLKKRSSQTDNVENWCLMYSTFTALRTDYNYAWKWSSRRCIWIKLHEPKRSWCQGLVPGPKILCL